MAPKDANNGKAKEPKHYTRGRKAMITKRAGYKAARRACKATNWLEELTEGDTTPDQASDAKEADHGRN